MAGYTNRGTGSSDSGSSLFAATPLVLAGADVATIEITDLDGDEHGNYELHYHGPCTNTTENIRLRVNGVNITTTHFFSQNDGGAAGASAGIVGVCRDTIDIRVWFSATRIAGARRLFRYWSAATDVATFKNQIWGSGYYDDAANITALGFGAETTGRFKAGGILTCTQMPG